MSNPSSTPRTIALIGSLVLSACAQTPPSVSEAPPMSAPAPESAATPTAASLLQSLIDLIIATPQVQEVTAVSLGAAMHLPVQSWSATHYGFGGPLTSDWRYSMEVDQASMHGPRADFSFLPAKKGEHPAASDICALDFDAFSNRLTAAGFKQETRRGEHGQVVDQRFMRDRQTVTVLTQGEADTPDAARHACVVSVIVS